MRPPYKRVSLRRVLTVVTGGGGRLGNVLVRQLIEDGHHVRVLEPGPRPPSLEGLDIDFISGSVLDAADVARAVEGVDVVYHLAAKIQVSATRRSPKPLAIRFTNGSTHRRPRSKRQRSRA